ncbi:hypothetical protein JDV02_004473 [Purpureocillium takamizusanense]|uniref:Uncharacterized protein n=1 Tax=Purpureocillium takamizusanense TaxID=2060973 RepID=A0A9Q8QCL0_9HYPO|nr:uncharacterized protein JDV02_004473 [Purpureocillium takamizusanense]UNI18189.1 hypothetical protein JDV02_004473 [Purpureocillium takamizusanense]
MLGFWPVDTDVRNLAGSKESGQSNLHSKTSSTTAGERLRRADMRLLSCQALHLNSEEATVVDNAATASTSTRYGKIFLRPMLHGASLSLPAYAAPRFDHSSNGLDGRSHNIGVRAQPGLKVAGRSQGVHFCLARVAGCLPRWWARHLERPPDAREPVAARAFNIAAESRAL